MNKKYTGIPVLILLIIFFLGIGYAVIDSVVLYPQEVSSPKKQELDVVFKETTKVTDLDKVTAEKSHNEDLKANVEVKDLKLNETVSAVYTVQNKELDVHVNLITKKIENSNPEYFAVRTNLKENEIVPSKNGELDVEISITLIKTPVKKEDSTTTIKITFDAIPVSNKNRKEN